MRFAVVALSLCAAGDGRAQSACALNYPQAVACHDPESAARAYRVLGRDPHALDKDYVRAVFEQAHCVAFANVADAGQPIEIGQVTRVPDLNGWTIVKFVVVKSSRYGLAAVWVADDYLSGACELVKRPDPD